MSGLHQVALPGMLPRNYMVSVHIVTLKMRYTSALCLQMLDRSSPSNKYPWASFTIVSGSTESSCPVTMHMVWDAGK